MKYNPKVNEKTASLPGFTNLHPLQDAEMVQGAMQLLFELQVYLAEISGFAAVTLQPAAGAHGELTGVLIMRKYQLDRGETQRTKILVPDSAHGTNPATTTMSGLQVVELPSDARGNVDLEALKANLDDTRGRPDADQPQHAGPVRGARAGGHPAGARGRRTGLRRRRQPERHRRHRQAGRAGLRRDALQPAQDLQHAARRRRARRRPGRRRREAGALPARASGGRAARRRRLP